MPYSRDGGYSTTRLDGKNVRINGNSGLDPLILSDKTLTIEAPDLQLSIYPSQTGSVKILKENATTLASFDASTSSLNMNGNKITGLADGVNPTDAVSKSQMDTAVSGISSSRIQNSTNTTSVEAGSTNVVISSGTATTTTTPSQFFVDNASGSLYVSHSPTSNTFAIERAGSNIWAIQTGAGGELWNYSSKYVFKGVSGGLDVFSILTGATPSVALNGSMSVKDSGATNRFVVDTVGSLITARYNFDLGNTYRLTGLAQGVNPNDSVNKLQMDNAIAGAVGGVSSFSISRAGASVVCETTGFITYNGAAGTGHNFKVNTVAKGVLTDNTFETYTDVVSFKLPASGYLSVWDSTFSPRFVVDTLASLTTSRYDMSFVNTYKLTNLLAGTAGSNDSCNVAQMESKIISSLTPYLTSATAASTYSTPASVASAVAGAYSITRGSGDITMGTSGQAIATIPSGQFLDVVIGGTRQARFSASNGGLGVLGLQTQGLYLTSHAPYVSGTAVSPSMTIIHNSGGGIIEGATLPIRITTPQLKIYGKVSGTIPFLITDYLGTTNKLLYDETNDKVSINSTNGLDMNNKRIALLADGTLSTDAVNKGQMDSAISAAVLYQITRASAYVNCQTTGDIDYYVSGSGNKHKFYVQGTLGAVFTVEATGDTAVKNSNAQCFYLHNNVFSRGAANTTIFYNSGTTIEDNPSTDAIWLKGNVKIQPSTTNTNLLLVNNVAGSSRLTITNTNATLQLPLNMSNNKITGLTAGAATGEAVEFSQVSSAITNSHNPYEIVRGTTNLSINGGGDLVLTMPVNTASFNIPDPSNAGYDMSSWTTQSSLSYQINRCRTRVQYPTSSPPYLQTWFNSVYGTANTQPEILSSTHLNLAVSGSTDHINFRHNISGGVGTLTARIASDYFDIYPSVGQRVYKHSGALALTLDISGTNPTIISATDILNINDKVIFTNTTNGVDAYSFRNSSGVNVMTVDTTNNRLVMNNTVSAKITGLTAGAATGEAVEFSQVSSAITNSHNPYELVRSGTSSYVRVNVDDVIINAANTGAVYNYYNGNAISVIGGLANEVYVADTGFKWRKGSSSGTEMYKISATSTAQTKVDISNDNLLHSGKMTIRPYANNGSILTIQTLGGNIVGYFDGNDISATSRFFSPNNHQIKYVGEPTHYQDATTKQYVDDRVGNTEVIIDNLVRNPTMAINQRAAGSSGSGTIPVDGWNVYFENPYTTIIQEEINDLGGFRWCLKTTTTAADNRLIHIASNIEGTMVRDLQLGSPNVSRTLTISAWVKSSIAYHKFCFFVYLNGYECPSSATTGIANIWVRVSATIPAPPSAAGEALTTTATSIILAINPSVPTSQGGTNQVWKQASTGRAFGLSDGSTNMMNVSGTNTFRFTGYQVDVGSVMLPFRHIAHDENLRRCQRYYYRLNGVVDEGIAQSCALYGTTHYFTVPLPVRMRITPVCSSTVAFKVWSPQTGSNQNSTSVVNHTGASPERYGVYYTLASAYYYYSCLIQFGGTGAIIANADL